MRHLQIRWLAASTIVLAAAAPRLCATTQSSEEITTVILVRHSERDDSGGRDPSLSAAGEARARALAHALGETRIDAVYATQFARTQETAEPLAQRLGLDVIVYTAGSDYVNEMAELVRSEHTGQTIVVVSHSNTVPGIIAALGATPVPTIDEDEYDDLYVVTIPAGGGATVLHLRYGAPTP